MSWSKIPSIGGVTFSSDEGKQLVIDAAQVKNNYFVADVIGKLVRFGSISLAQANAVRNAIARANEPKEPAGEAPVGRQTVVGVIVGTKVKTSDFGPTLKMTVKLENGAKVWCSVPASIKPKVHSNEYCNIFLGDRRNDDNEGSELKGCKISLTATFTHSDNDKSFAFGKRPQADILERPAPVAVAA